MIKLRRNKYLSSKKLAKRIKKTIKIFMRIKKKHPLYFWFILSSALVFLFILTYATSYFFLSVSAVSNNFKNGTFWKFQAIDTMKFSRDLAREKLTDVSFDEIIEMQIQQIARSGATHIAIATPYDEEFLPYLNRWVKKARKHNLKIWFRGNWSGWERWFSYPSISRSEHITKTEQFIKNNDHLFEDGDVFSACPECENGGPGDPRFNGDVKGHREFLINEYKITKKTFQEINRDVASNYNSMNGDVAFLIMDKKTTAALDGIVTIDHYVKTPEQLVADIDRLAENSGGKVILGEYGAPIPDIHGAMSEEEQAAWLNDALMKLIEADNLLGLSYWTHIGSSTHLWNDDGSPRKAAEILKKVYAPTQVYGKIINELGQPIQDAQVSLQNIKVFSQAQGDFSLPLFSDSKGEITVEATGFKKKIIEFTTSEQNIQVELVLENESPLFKIRKFLHNFTQ